MNIERAIEFIIKNQARMDARLDAKFDRANERFAQAEKRFAQAEKRFAQAETRLNRLERVVTQNNRVVTKLAQVGVTLRSDVRRTEKNLADATERLSGVERNLEKASVTLSETEDKLNALVDLVDRHIRGNGRQP